MQDKELSADGKNMRNVSVVFLLYVFFFFLAQSLVELHDKEAFIR